MFVLYQFALHDLQVSCVLAERPAFFNIKVKLQLGFKFLLDLLVHKLVIFPIIIVFQFLLVYDNSQSFNLFVRYLRNFLHHELCLRLQRLHMVVKCIVVGSETPRVLLLNDSKEIIRTITIITVESFPYFYWFINFQSQAFDNLA